MGYVPTVNRNRKRQQAAAIVLALIAVAIVLAVLLSDTKVNAKRAQAEAYCKNEPGISITGPEFKNCVDQYLSLR